MKYIKIYEWSQSNSNLKYKSLDYVYVFVYDDSEFSPLSRIKFVNAKKEKRTWDYLIEAYSYDRHEICNSYIPENLILRELTPEEIEEYKSKIEAKKYNL